MLAAELATLTLLWSRTNDQNAVPPPPEWSATLDCGHPVYAVDRLICGDPRLIAGARNVEAAYLARSTGLEADREDALRLEQEAWSKRRNLCVFEHRASACVVRLQAVRLRQLATPETERP